MRKSSLAAALLVFTACGARKVVVESAPSPAAEVRLSVTNHQPQAINVYVVRGGTDTFLNQVASNTTQLLPVPDVPTGTVVDLKARTVDGTRTFTRSGVVMRGTVTWELR
jgi:hypothetical protein